jgi:iron-sulfur cluster assembly protein
MILISPAASYHLRCMIRDRHEASSAAPDAAGERGGSAGTELGLRILVEKGGCAGMQYVMRLDAAGPEDVVVESGGAKVLLDPASAQFISGSELDYCDDLVGTGFRLNNPRAARSCGCGTSFEPAAEEPVAKEALAAQ